ncbi:MAG: PAS domain S-box protein, partial [Bacteroidia bacterium]
ISEGIVKLDRSYRIRFVNKRLCELLSCCDLDLMDKNIFDAFEFDSESKKDIEKNVLTDRKKLQSSFQVRVKTRNGLMKTMLVSIVLMKEPYNPENRFLCTIKDITERQELVQLFNESETRFKTIFDQSSLGILILSSEHGLITDVNPTAKKILGWTKKELVGNSLLDICHPIYQPVVKEMWDQYIRAGENELFIETKLQHKENKSIWGGITIGEFIQDNSKDGPSYIAYIRDISERKKMEQKLKAKDIEKENILKAIPESFLVIDKNGIVNRSYLKSTELFPKYDIVDGKMYTEVFEKQVINQVTKNIIKCIKNGETISEVLEYDKNERQYYYDFRYIKLKGANVLITISDITNVKTSVRQLQQYFNIIEQAKELILITDSTGKIEYVNPTFTEVTGYTMEELKGRNPSVLKSGKHTKSFYSDLWQSIITNNSIRTEIINKKKTGETYIEEKIITSIRNEEGKITNFISTGRDVTEIRKKERKIQIYQRFEKILQKREQKTRTLSLIKGQENERKRLARELHDSLGQMLTITKANLYNLKLEKILDPQEKEKIALAQELISEIIQESRIISYNLSPGALYEFGLNKVLSQMVQSINSNIKGTRILYEENLGETRFNSEVEINLYRIIQEAIQNSIKHSRAKTIRLSINQKKGILSVIVEDDGKGMETDALIAKRFSGGLNNIEERSRAIDGKVVFNTQPGQGFRISLTLKTKPILV